MNVMMMEMNTETMDSGSVYMLVSMLMLLHDDDVAHDDDDDDDDNDDNDDDNVDDEVRRGSSPLLAAPAPRLRRGVAARSPMHPPELPDAPETHLARALGPAGSTALPKGA